MRPRKHLINLLIIFVVVGFIGGCGNGNSDVVLKKSTDESLPLKSAILFVLVNELTIKDSTLHINNYNSINPARCLGLVLDLPVSEGVDTRSFFWNKMCGIGLISESIKSRTDILPWIYDIGMQEPLGKTVEVILGKFQDIENRLTIAYNNQNTLTEKYGADFPTKNIDDDIKHLSNLGWQLVEPTKKFFALAKQHMMKIDEANARTEAMQGLKTFTQEIEVAGNQPSAALEQSVANITTAINHLEKALNE